MTRNEARELLMQILYELDTTKSLTKDEGIRLVESKLSGNHIKRGTDLISGIIENLAEIDSQINSHSRSWKTNRMAKVDLAIIRLCIGEMTYLSDVPSPVAINEAINLAKKYSTEQSSKFIHGVLGAIAKEHEQTK